MKKGSYFGLGCLTSILLLIGVIGFSVYSLSKLSINDLAAKKIKSGSVLEIDLQGPVAEYSKIKSDRFFYQPTSVVDITHAIRAAKSDNRISGIVIKPQFLQSGYASINEIVVALEDFKTSKKPVRAFLEMASNSDILVASVADEIVISNSSSAGIFLKGYGVNMAFYKRLFDGLGIKMHVNHAGKYKDYGSQYTKESLSPEMKSNLLRIIQSRLDLFEDQVGNNYNKKLLSSGKIIVNSMINNEDILFLEPEECKKSGLVDKTSPEYDFNNFIEEKYTEVISVTDYVTNLSLVKENTNNKIAVLYLDGSIMHLDSDFRKINADWVEDAVKEILKDSSIKGCVLRVNSPGGSALESEKILRVLKELKEEMPVVVSMGNYAASGGYMISMVGSKIFADPYTVTGSIGVVQLLPDISKLYDNIGITHDRLEVGKKSTWLNPLNGVSKAQLNAYNVSINRTYKAFKTIVLEGREGVFNTLDDVEKVAQGQVWDSISARENGLIDEIGTLNNALEEVRQMANIEQFSRENFPIRKDLLTMYLEDKIGFTEVKSLVLKESSELLLEKQQLLESCKRNPIQTVLPYRFDD